MIFTCRCVENSPLALFTRRDFARVHASGASWPTRRLRHPLIAAYLRGFWQSNEQRVAACRPEANRPYSICGGSVRNTIDMSWEIRTAVELVHSTVKVIEIY